MECPSSSRKCERQFQLDSLFASASDTQPTTTLGKLDLGWASLGRNSDAGTRGCETTPRGAGHNRGGTRTLLGCCLAFDVRRGRRSRKPPLALAQSFRELFMAVLKVLEKPEILGRGVVVFSCLLVPPTVW